MGLVRSCAWYAICEEKDAGPKWMRVKKVAPACEIGMEKGEGVIAGVYTMRVI